MTTPLPNASHLHPFWVATAFVNYTSALPMIEIDLRTVQATSPHHAEAIACRLLLEEIGRSQAHIICALGKPDHEQQVDSAPDAPVPESSLALAPVHGGVPLSPFAQADALADAKAEVENLRGQLLTSIARANQRLSILTRGRLMKALVAANFNANETELTNVASTLLGRMVSNVQPLKEADGRAVLAFLESSTPERLDLLFPVNPTPLTEAG